MSYEEIIDHREAADNYFGDDRFPRYEKGPPTYNCSGATYHLPACGGTCGEEDDERD